MTIRARLTVVYGTVIAIVLATAGTLVFWQLNEALLASLDQTLETRALGIAATMENAGTGLQEGDTPPQPGEFVAIFDAHGALLDSSAGTPVGFAAPAVSGRAELTSGGVRYMVHATLLDTGMVAVAGRSLTEVQATTDRLASTLLAVGIGAAVASMVAGWWLAGRALKPVAALAGEAAQIGPTDIDHRLPVPQQRDELRALVLTLNGMLDRVADAVSRQRMFVAAASHDLRTPIAALQAELELADDARSTPSELRAAVRIAHADALRLRELATGLLDLAAAEGAGCALVRTSLDGDALVDAAVRRVEPLARDRGMRIERSGLGGDVNVDRVRIEQALTNLLLNALSFGPDGSDIEVRISLEEGLPRWLLIEVLDRGPGVPTALMPRLFEPFVHGTGGHHGTGLGLAAARAAILAHRGSIGFDLRPGGGTRFWFRVPA